MAAVTNSSAKPTAQMHTGQLWADKYKPRTIAQMCYPTYANKLKAWMESFTAAGAAASKHHRGALLSGPPGVGKTTTVYVVAAELGRVVVEYNASDFRSRKSLRERVADITNNRTFSAAATSYTQVVLLMDEVDGCDLGGVGEVIEMIKETKIPIVCTCNDRWHPKLRSLLNYVEDLRFSRPPCNIVANYLCDRVLAREGISLSKVLLQDVIKRSGSDIRNMLNNLQMWCLNRRTLEQRQLAACAAQSTKNGDVGLFEAAEYLLLQGTSRGERRSISEMEACCYNGDLVDLFVQENYLHFNPVEDGRDWMAAVSDAATSISRADAAQRIMYMEQNWSVSRMHVLFSSIAPCVSVRGKYESFLSGQQVFFDRQRPVKFPSWLGQNSTATKNRRLLRCLTMQASNPTEGSSGNQEDVALDYIPSGWLRPLTAPLCQRGKDGIAEVIRTMDQYGITREDWDFIADMASFKRMRTTSPNAVPDIPSAVKSAFTREYNKSHSGQSFTRGTLTHLPSSPTGGEAGGEESDGEDDQEDLRAALVKQPKVSVGAPATAAGRKRAPAAKKSAAPRKRARKTAGADKEAGIVVSDNDG